MAGIFSLIAAIFAAFAGGYTIGVMRRATPLGVTVLLCALLNAALVIAALMK
jgi:hypothetical protein